MLYRSLVRIHYWASVLVVLLSVVSVGFLFSCGQISMRMVSSSPTGQPALPDLPSDGDWGAPIQVTRNVAWDGDAAIVQRPDGGLLCTFRSARTPSYYSLWSIESDNGSKWVDSRLIGFDQLDYYENSVVLLDNGTALCAARRQAYVPDLAWFRRVGSTWTFIGTICPGYNPSLVRISDTEYLLAFDNAVDIYIARIQSGTGLVTVWQVTNDAANDKHPSLVRTAEGSYLMTFASDREGSWALFAASSPDAKTWTINRVTSNTYTDCKYNCLVQSREGVFVAAFRARDAGAYQDVFLTDSPDGVTWSPPVKVPLQNYDDKGRVSLIQRCDTGFTLTYDFRGEVYTIHTGGALSITLTTLKERYAHHEQVRITASAQFANASPCVGCFVSFTTYFPNGSLYFVATQATNPSGSALLAFFLADRPGGSYRVLASITVLSEGEGKAQVSFFYLFYYADIPASIVAANCSYENRTIMTNSTIANYGLAPLSLVLYLSVFDPSSVPFRSQCIQVVILAQGQLTCSFALDLGQNPATGEYKVQLSLRTALAEEEGFCIDLADLMVNVAS